MVYIYDSFKTFYPAKVIRARSIDDVIRAVSYATSSGLKIRPMGLGYSWSEHSFTKEFLCNWMDCEGSVSSIGLQRP